MKRDGQPLRTMDMSVCKRRCDDGVRDEGFIFARAGLGAAIPTFFECV